MAISYELTPEQRKHQAERIGKIFGLPDAAMKISSDGVYMESDRPGKALLKVELIEIITEEEAIKILNAEPLAIQIHDRC